MSDGLEERVEELEDRLNFIEYGDELFDHYEHKKLLDILQGLQPSRHPFFKEDIIEVRRAGEGVEMVFRVNEQRAIDIIQAVDIEGVDASIEKKDKLYTIVIKARYYVI